MPDLWELADGSGYLEELEQIQSRTERFQAMKAQPAALDPTGAGLALPRRRTYRCPVVHRGRITAPRLTRPRSPNKVKRSEQLKEVARQRKAAEREARCQARRRLHHAYGNFAAAVMKERQAACEAVEALWEPESDEGNDGHGSPPGPSFDFERLERQAVKALVDLSALQAAATKAMALAVMCLSRRDRRALLRGRHPAPTLENSYWRRRRATLPDPGHSVAVSPHLTNGPPSRFTAPPEWAQVGWLAA